MTTQRIITISQDLANVAFGIKTPWFIVNASQAVGVYTSRTTARAAKSNGEEGTDVSLKEITFEIAAPTEAIEAKAIEQADPIIETPAEVTEVEEESKPFGFEDHGLTHCPECGAHLNNGVGVHNQEVNGEKIKHDEFEYCCLGCGTEFGRAIKGQKAPKAKAEKVIENNSTVTIPCQLVWDLADAMAGARRKDVIAAAVEKGVAYYTARTQYQLWAQVQKEMADRAAAAK